MKWLIRRRYGVLSLTLFGFYTQALNTLPWQWALGFFIALSVAVVLEGAAQ